MKNIKKKLNENADLEIYSHEEDFYNGKYSVIAEYDVKKYRSNNLFFKVYNNNGDNDEWDLLAAFDVNRAGDIEPTPVKDETIEFSGKLYCVDNEEAATELIDIINTCVDDWSDGRVILDLDPEEFVIDGSEEYLGSYNFDRELRRDQGLPERNDDIDDDIFEARQFNRRKRKGCCKRCVVNEGLKDTLKATPEKIKKVLGKVSAKLGSKNQVLMNRALNVVDQLENKNVPVKKYLKSVKDIPALLSDNDFENKPLEEKEMAIKVMIIMTLLASGLTVYEISQYFS